VDKLKKKDRGKLIEQMELLARYLI